MSSFGLARPKLSASRRLATRLAAARRYQHDRSHAYQDRFAAISNYFQYGRLPPVRILRPALWCLGTTAVVYVGCAAYEVRQDVAQLSTAQSGLWHRPDANVTYDELEAISRFSRGHDYHASLRQPPPPWLSGLHEPVVAALGLNVAGYLASKAFWRVDQFLTHYPFDGRSYTLLTSTFGHFGFLPLAINMYLLLRFAPVVMQTEQFEHSNGHAVAFYLGAGTIAAMGQHVASAVSRNPLKRLTPVGGASGAVYALVSALAVDGPDRRFGIILVPGVSFTAQQFLTAVAALEAVGLVWSIPYLPFFGHAAHLAGLATGAAYVYFDGKRRLWQPTRRFAFKQMQRVGMI